MGSNLYAGLWRTIRNAGLVIALANAVSGPAFSVPERCIGPVGLIATELEEEWRPCNCLFQAPLGYDCSASPFTPGGGDD